MKSSTDKGAVWSLTICFALFLLSMSVLWVHRPMRALPSQSFSAAAANSKDLPMEHWNDPKVIHEERFQLTGLIIFLIGIGGIETYRRRTLSKSYRERVRHEK